ncbi:MAG: hypothetical protein DMG06_18665 [Acidobacteria bacterium]|nr:MAG: hypothetical protein DMG06_18665 [Acidobacteriota bacterium]
MRGSTLTNLNKVSTSSPLSGDLEIGHFAISAGKRRQRQAFLPVKLISGGAQDRQECLSPLEMFNLQFATKW